MITPPVGKNIGPFRNRTKWQVYEEKMGRRKGSTKRVWESVKMYTIQCANCSKWRLIPSKEKYEDIRDRIAEQPFQCEKAREWRPNASCEDEPDIEPDGSYCWAMDKPNIPRTPAGWQRIIRVRAEGGTKFADIYYVAPCNKRLRSMVELDRYLAENPKYQQQGIIASQFSFQSPVPLDANYVTKRRSLSSCAHEKNGDPLAVQPISQLVLYENADSQDVGPSKKRKKIMPSARRGRRAK